MLIARSTPRARRAVAVLLSLACAAPCVAQSVTTAALQIGGPGAVGCAGTGDPPLLPGAVAATATLDFAYDLATSTLTVTATNTSPVFGGANPVMTRIAFNVPQFAVAGAALVSVSSAGGAVPAWDFEADFDQAPPNPLSAGCLGKYGMFLEAASGTGIGNAAASSFALPTVAVSTGPTTFVFAIMTTSPDLTAWSFARSLPVNGAGQPLPNAACRFKGPAAASAADWIGSAPDGSPAGWVVGAPISGQTVTLVQSGAPGWYGCMVASLVPGPTDVLGLSFPIGVPAIVLMAEVLPASGVSTLSFVIPHLPPPPPGVSTIGVIATLDIYGATLVLSPDGRTLQVSEGFTLTITDEDVFEPPPGF